MSRATRCAPPTETSTPTCASSGCSTAGTCPRALPARLWPCATDARLTVWLWLDFPVTGPTATGWWRWTGSAVRPRRCAAPNWAAPASTRRRRTTAAITCADQMDALIYPPVTCSWPHARKFLILPLRVESCRFARLLWPLCWAGCSLHYPYAIIILNRGISLSKSWQLPSMRLCFWLIPSRADYPHHPNESLSILFIIWKPNGNSHSSRARYHCRIRLLNGSDLRSFPCHRHPFHAPLPFRTRVNPSQWLRFAF